MPARQYGDIDSYDLDGNSTPNGSLLNNRYSGPFGIYGAAVLSKLSKNGTVTVISTRSRTTATLVPGLALLTWHDDGGAILYTEDNSLDAIPPVLSWLEPFQGILDMQVTPVRSFEDIKSAYEKRGPDRHGWSNQQCGKMALPAVEWVG